MVGLVLEGGGARGSFHMGAVKALLEEGYEFSGISGTSIGAFNGAIIVQGDFEKGYKLWKEIDMASIFNLEYAKIEKFINKKINKKEFLYFSAMIRDIFENKGIDTKNIRKILNSIIDEKKLRKSKMEFGLVTVSLSDIKPLEIYKEDIPDGKLVDYLMASANLPIFKIRPIEGKYFIDGGFYDNCPINLLVRKGYKNIIVIRTFRIGRVRKVKDKDVSITKIVPSGDLGSILNFDKDAIQVNLKMGYYDAMHSIKNLKGEKYYIQPLKDEKFFLGLSKIPDETINKMGEIINVTNMEPKRMFFEKIIPTLSHMLKLSKDASYQEVIIGVLEVLALERKIDRFKIRNFRSFLNEIKVSNVEKKDESNSFIPQLAEKAKLDSLFYKEEVIKKVGEELLKGLYEKRF